MTTAQDVHVGLEGRNDVLNLCANNYLGLANHPAIVEAAHEALDRWGYGMWRPFASSWARSTTRRSSTA